MYYVFDRKALLTGRWIDDEPFIDDIDFDIGNHIDKNEIEEPLAYELTKINTNSDDHGPYLPAYLRSAYPLFRNDLIDTLISCGVDNLQVFPAIILDPENSKHYDNYNAVNIVGLVSVADLEQAAINMLIFRLAESTKTIIVTDKIKDALIENGFDKDLDFYNLEEIATW